MNSIFENEEGKTHYQILNQLGVKTTIAIDKWVADVLQKALANVHCWVQTTYIKCVEKYPDATRRKHGDMVRLLALKKAHSCEKELRQVLGDEYVDLSPDDF